MFRAVVFTLLLACSLASVVKLRPRFPDHRIVGGMLADIKDHPYQLTFQMFGSHMCGASIISNKWAITAGHCVGYPASYYSLGAGSSQKKEGTFYNVERVIRHPKYDSSTIDYDIALLEISGEILFNDGAQPVGLPDVEVDAGEYVDITGWGTTQQGGWISESLMKVSVPIVEREICGQAYQFMNQITTRMICAGNLSEGGEDACQGDSGGPLVADNILYGVVSWGYGCAQPNYPGVYTNVAELREWIKENTGV